MALVSVVDAKHHLRITSDEQDADIVLKIDQASAIILTYLKNRLTAIASISVANPTVITTSVPHSLTSGASATIADTTSTPTVNGARVVTVTGLTTFTVPVNVTIGQASAAGTVSSPAWTDTTAPDNVIAATLYVLEDLYERRPINWEIVRDLLVGLRDPALA
jgi:Phage gp6-like head-tail connector protein